jgi:hypothetical protein
MRGYKPSTGKDTNHWRGKERMQTIGRGRREYSPLTGEGRIQTIGRKRREMIQTIGGDRRGYNLKAGKGEDTQN